MKLFLASSLDKTLHRLKEVAPDVGKKVLFVANAADPYVATMDLFWIRLDREVFQKEGYQLEEIDLRTSTPEEFDTKIKESDILHIAGGGVYYLIELLKSGGFDKIIIERVKDGSVVYTATSAGSIIASETLATFAPDKEETVMMRDSLNKVGLGLINFVIVPHNDNPVWGSNEAMVTAMQNNPEALFFLRDNQAVWVDDGGARLVSA